jgi:hypothetical protein
MADPANGKFRTNQATFSASTAIAVSTRTYDNIDRTNLLANLKVNDTVELQDKSNSANFARYELSAAPTNNSTWFQLPLTWIAGGGTAPAGNSQVIFTFSYGTGSVPPVTSVFGRTGAVVAATNDYAFSQLSGSIAAAQIPASTITYGMIQNETVSTLLGRGSASGGPPQEIALGTNLAMSSNTLNATGGGTPGGSNTYVQFNDSGVFGGTSGLTFTKATSALAASGPISNSVTGTGALQTLTVTAADPGGGATNYNSIVFNNGHGAGNFKSQFKLQSAGVDKWALGNDYSGNGGQTFFLYDATTNSAVMFWNTNTNIRMHPSEVLGFSGTGGAGDASGALDIGLARNAAGVLEIDNGTVGQFGDLKVRTTIHNGYTVATLPTAVAGMTAYVTDGTASLAWGATVTGGASTKYLVWYNGTNWTVVGK